MFKTLRCLLLFNLIFLCFIYLTSSQLCTPDALKNCAKDLSADPIFNLTLINVNESAHKDYCSKYKAFSYCFEVLRPNCNGMEAILAYYDGLNKAHNYLCETAKQEYFKNRYCYTDSMVLQSSARCDKELEIYLDSIKEMEPKGKIINHCKFIDMYLRCLDNVFRSLCTVEALNWAINFKSYIVGPLMKLYECPGWDIKTPPEIDKTILLLSIILSLVAFFAILVTCILLLTKTTVCRRCVNRWKNRGAAVDSNPPEQPEQPVHPPSYEGIVRLQKMWKQLSHSPDDQTPDSTIDFSAESTFQSANPVDDQSTHSSEPSIFQVIPQPEQPAYSTRSNSESKSSEKSAEKGNKQKHKCFLKNCRPSTSRKTAAAGSAESTLSSVFATDLSGDGNPTRRPSSGFQTYRGSSELSVYALVHQVSDFEKKISKV